MWSHEYLYNFFYFTGTFTCNYIDIKPYIVDKYYVICSEVK